MNANLRSLSWLLEALFVIALLAQAPAAVQSVAPNARWAVLVAGSNFYYNYRHQADIAHAYKNLIRHGMAEDHIIVMMYDDIARSHENPDYNILLNRPYSENVYKNIRIDYTKEDVTPQTFLAVLSGDREKLRDKGTGRYVEATANDNVFIYMSDHGATGLFGFPSSYLYADDLINGLTSLKSRVKNVLVFMEACEAGSMFSGYLTDDSGIIVVTASNAYESSWAYYSSIKYNTYLGDEFSINVMEYIEKADPHSTRISDVIQVAKIQTKSSHVSVYGDLNMDMMPLSDFFGSLQQYQTKPERAEKAEYEKEEETEEDQKLPVTVEAQYVQRTIAQRNLRKNSSDVDAINLLQTESKIEMIFDQIKDKYQSVFSTSDVTARTAADSEPKRPVFYGNIKKCYSASIEHFDRVCFKSNQYNLVFSYFNHLYKLCQAKVHRKEIIATLNELCGAV